MTRTGLKGLDLNELRTFVEQLGEKPFRAEQIFQWLYGHGATSFDQMSNLSKELRAKLTREAQIGQLRLVTSQTSSKDQTVKSLFELHDGSRIESVLMPDDRRTTLCVSTQVGCAIDCKFCATGLMGLQRHLTAGEIVDQILAMQRATGRRVTNVVFMGMGEPFHNYENVMKACALMSSELGPNLANRHIVVSTSGLVPRIIQYADEGHKYRLAISLNATTDAARDQLMPLNKKWPIKALLEAAKYYNQKSGEPLTFEYVLLDGINDTQQDADRLKRLAKGVSCKINLIPYNATEGKFRRPSEARIVAFFQRMSGLNAPVTIRWSRGDDIDAACGQLATAV